MNFYLNKKYHYVYLITELSTGIQYIGIRSSDIIPEQDIGIIYFSSSTNKQFMKNQSVNKHDYTYEVLSIYDTRENALNEEIRLHSLYNVADNDGFYNKMNSCTEFSTFGHVTTKDKDGNIHYISTDHPKYLSGEYKPLSHGLSTMFDRSGNPHKVYPDDHRIASGELKSGILCHNKKHKTFTLCDENDHRIASGEYIPIDINKL